MSGYKGDRVGDVQGAGHQDFWYFQLRDFPFAIHSTACSTRFLRVSSRLASAIQVEYSCRQLGLKAAKALAAGLFLLTAALSSRGTATAFFFKGLGGRS